MAKVKKYSGNGEREKMTSVWNDAGDKRYGFTSKDRIGGRTRYGAGIDNIGSPYRDDYSREINTPLGMLDYGNEGDTVYAGFTPNASSDQYGRRAWANITPDIQARAGEWYNSPYTDQNYYAALNWGSNAPGEFRLPDFNVNVPTAVGNVGVGTNDGNPNIYANYTPNAYIQALANLLMGR